MRIAQVSLCVIWIGPSLGDHFVQKIGISPLNKYAIASAKSFTGNLVLLLTIPKARVVLQYLQYYNTWLFTVMLSFCVVFFSIKVIRHKPQAGHHCYSPYLCVFLLLDWDGYKHCIISSTICLWFLVCPFVCLPVAVHFTGHRLTALNETRFMQVRK